MTDKQIILCVCDTLWLLEQLGMAEAAELLNRVKVSESNPLFSSIVIDTNMSVSEAESILFVSSVNSNIAGSERLCEEQASSDEDTDFSSTPLKVPSNENLQSVSSSELVTGLPTLPSNSPLPATQISKKNNCCRLESMQSKITKMTHTDMKKSLTKCSQVGKQSEFAELEELSVMTSSSLAMNTLYGLSDPDLQQALELDEELIRDGLTDYQSFCI
ncbi:predicted protein [Histoplasma capsulatum var. duboisii H88]|uniref:Predicted protein n=1 Tax=Ajellomyces capsulatus (strain H88) TaxID=544711 RepID=F0UFY1_AJEC8|nr:predicted protein [Histoplasma capsulatum var. duboisii H88]